MTGSGNLGQHSLARSTTANTHVPPGHSTATDLQGPRLLSLKQICITLLSLFGLVKASLVAVTAAGSGTTCVLGLLLLLLLPFALPPAAAFPGLAACVVSRERRCCLPRRTWWGSADAGTAGSTSTPYGMPPCVPFLKVGCALKPFIVAARRARGLAHWAPAWGMCRMWVEMGTIRHVRCHKPVPMQGAYE